MSWDLVEAVQMKAVFFFWVLFVLFYRLQGVCHSVFMLLVSFCYSSSHRNFLQKN